MTSAKNAIRASVFVSAVAIALLAADQTAHADDAPAQAETPSPDPGAGAPPTDVPVVTPTPTTPPVSTPAPDPQPVPADPPPPVVTPVPDGSIDIPPVTRVPVIPSAPGTESDSPAIDGPFPAGTGTTTNQGTGVVTDGTAVANTGGNSGIANATGHNPLDEISVTPGQTSAGVTTGNATGQGSVDHTGISQQVNAIVTENGRVVVVQVAIVVNIGIGLAGSGGNVAGDESALPPRPVSSVGMIVGNESSGAGTGPTPVRINTGTANATGNTGNTQVTQSIVLTGNDVASQLAAVLNIGVGVSNSGLNFALASVSGNNSGTPSSVTFVTMGGGSSIGAGPASALGNRSTSAVFQVVTVTASGNGSLLVVQRAIIVNFGLALANSGRNVAGGGAISAAMPDTGAAQQLLLALLAPGGSSHDAISGVSGSGGGLIGINTGGANAIGNDTTTGIHQSVTGSVTGEQTAQAIQDAWVGNFGLGVANSGYNSANAGLAGIDAASLDAARGALAGVPRRPHRDRRPGAGTRRDVPARLEPAPAPRRCVRHGVPARDHRARDADHCRRRFRRHPSGDRGAEHRARARRFGPQRRRLRNTLDDPRRRDHRRRSRVDDHHHRGCNIGREPLRDHGLPDHRRRRRVRRTGPGDTPRRRGARRRSRARGPPRSRDPTGSADAGGGPVRAARPAGPGCHLDPAVHRLSDRRRACGWIRAPDRGNAVGPTPTHRGSQMSITSPERLRDPEPLDTDWVTDVRPAARDTVVVTCGACNGRQRAPGDARGFTCESCATDWDVLRCRGCRAVSLVIAGSTACPQCAHEHPRPHLEPAQRQRRWLIEPEPLSVWLGGVKYLGGHAERKDPITVAGLLLDRRGIHLRAFSELFSIAWDHVLGISIEGPIEISERLTTSRLLALGATTWAMSVSYLTVRTAQGDAIFEVGGMAPPQVHARLSRVLQGLQRSDAPPAPVTIERGESFTPDTKSFVAPEPRPDLEARIDVVEIERHEAADIEPHTPIDLDLAHSEAPLEVLVIDGLWKLSRLQELGMLNETEVSLLRTRLLAHVTGDPTTVPGLGEGPLLHV